MPPPLARLHSQVSRALLVLALASALSFATRSAQSGILCSIISSRCAHIVGIVKRPFLILALQFQLNKTTSNYITFALSRNGDVNEQVQGQFTISEVIAGYENITSQPKLPVNELSNATKINQHWYVSILLCGYFVLTSCSGQRTWMRSLDPTARNLASSRLSKTPRAGALSQFLIQVCLFSLTLNIDGILMLLVSGFTLPQVPRKVSDAIYGRVQGAQYSSANGAWFIPCSQELNISFVLGGQTYPVHPLDTSSCKRSCPPHCLVPRD